MKNARKHTSFRLPEDCLQKIKDIQKRYSEDLGIEISQASVIVMLVIDEHKRLFGE